MMILLIVAKSAGSIVSEHLTLQENQSVVSLHNRGKLKAAG